MPPTTKKEKILIIESDPAFGRQIGEALSKRGYTAILATNNDAGVRALMDKLPHLVILDASISVGDRYDVLDKKQAEPMLAKIPVFMLSKQVTPINMNSIPQGSVKEFLVTLNMKTDEILEKVDHLFGYDMVVANAPAVAVSGDKKKLLWVEDDRLIGTILSKKLLSSGFDLFHAKNGEEALEALKTTKPDVIALDLVLPNMSGFDILQAARKSPNTEKTPVMILSNLSKQSDIEKAKALGAQKFLVKAAVSLDQIVEEIRAMTK